MKNIALIFSLAFIIGTANLHTSMCLSLGNSCNDLFAEYRELDPSKLCMFLFVINLLSNKHFMKPGLAQKKGLMTNLNLS